MNKRTAKGLFRRAIEKWGVASQFEMMVEEASELILAIKHYKRGRVSISKIAEECADAEIMCGQLRVICGDDLVDKWKDFKLDRLAKRLAGTDDPKMGELAHG